MRPARKREWRLILVATREDDTGLTMYETVELGVWGTATRPAQHQAATAAA